MPAPTTPNPHATYSRGSGPSQTQRAAAKRPETRAKRIGEAVRMAARNVQANQYRQPDEA